MVATIFSKTVGLHGPLQNIDSFANSSTPNQTQLKLKSENKSVVFVVEKEMVESLNTF